MMRPLFSSAMLLIVPCLGGCDSIGRFSDLDPRSSSPSISPIAPVSPTPTPNVTAQELPPPPSRFPGGQIGAAGQTAPDGTLQPPGAPPSGSQLPGGVAAPAAGDLTPPPGAPGQPPKVALATPGPKKTGISAPVEASVPEKPSQSRLTGGWSVSQGGGKCRLTLSNAPALDLYKAQTSGCSAGLTKVNAWELRGDEIYLYEQGGGVAARLKQTGNSSFNGSVAKSGAPVSISK